MPEPNHIDATFGFDLTEGDVMRHLDIEVTDQFLTITAHENGTALNSVCRSIVELYESIADARHEDPVDRMFREAFEPVFSLTDLGATAVLRRTREAAPAPDRRATSTVDYMYCDAANYKAWGTVELDVPVDDTLRRALVERIKATLSGGEHFIPQDVGLEPIEPGWDRTDDDHPWHTWVWDGEGFAEPGDPSAVRLEDLAELFEDARGRGWPGQVS